MAAEATTRRERELIQKWTQVAREATPEQQERLIIAADMMVLMGKYSMQLDSVELPGAME